MRRDAPRLAREVVAGLLQTAALSALALAAARYFSRALRPWGIVGLMAALVFTGHVYRRLRRPVAAPPPTWHEPDFDRPFARLGVIRERVRWGITSPGHFDAALRPMLAELAEEQLRRRHGIDRRRDPDRARAMLGEPLWQVIAEPPGAPPTIATLDALVRRIEEL